MRPRRGPPRRTAALLDATTACRGAAWLDVIACIAATPFQSMELRASTGQMPLRHWLCARAHLAKGPLARLRRWQVSDQVYLVAGHCAWLHDRRCSMKKAVRTPKTATQRKRSKRPPGLKIKTKVRAAGIEMQHNQTLVRASQPVH